MKICQPAETEQGTNSSLHGHFRSAPRYVIFDTETNEKLSLRNKRKKGEKDDCVNIATLGSQFVDVAIVGGLSRCSLNKMERCGIKVYKAVSQRLEDNIESLKKGELTELTPENTRRTRFC